jgi:hypothetical protein
MAFRIFAVAIHNNFYAMGEVDEKRDGKRRMLG